LFDILTKARPSLELLEGLVIPKSIKGKREAWLFIVPFLLLIYPLARMQDFATGAGIAAAAAGVLGFVLRTKLFALAKFQLEREHDRISQSLVDASALISHLRTTADERLRTQRTKNNKQKNQDLQTANQNHQTAITNGENNRDEQLRKINEVYAQKLVEIQTTQQRDIRTAIDSFDRRAREIEDASRENATKLDERYQAIKAKLQSRHETAYETLKARWRDGMAEVRATLEEVNRQVDSIAPRWDDPTWSDRPFARAVPPVLPFGEVQLDLDRMPQGI
ncbi:WXG100 family type VII secretion target, partial [Singulisphaera rosea]